MLTKLKNGIETALQVDLDGDGKIGTKKVYNYGGNGSQQHHHQHHQQDLMEVQAQVPHGVGPGQRFRIRTPSGQEMFVQVPAGTRAGQTIRVLVPRSAPSLPPVANAAQSAPMMGGGFAGYPGYPGASAPPRPSPSPARSQVVQPAQHAPAFNPNYRPDQSHPRERLVAWAEFRGHAYQPPPTAMQPARVETGRLVVASGRRRALLVGLNYPNTPARLGGCVNDVHKMRRFLLERGFTDTPETMLVLTDDHRDPRYFPTRANIIKAMQWLVQGASEGDVLFFHFSGHGAQETDHSGHESDGLNETIVPADFKQSGQISDDVLWGCLVYPLPSGCRLTALMDCCHCGTGLDLPYTWTAQGWREDVNPALSRGDVQMFSGCEDHQTSMDSYDQFGAGGAMTTAFIRANEEHPYATYPELLRAIHRNLQSRGFSQRPQLSSSQRFSVNERVFDLTDGFEPNHNPQVGRLQRRRFRPQNPSLGDSPLAMMLGLTAGLVAADLAFGAAGGLAEAAQGFDLGFDFGF